MLDVDEVLRVHRVCVERWHTCEIDQPHDGVLGTICEQHAFNFRLWHEEDQARSPTADDTVIANVKRRIDRLNQQRNDGIERIDDRLTQLLLESGIRPSADTPHNSETVGSICDRLSILSLRIYHLEEQQVRQDLTRELRQAVEQKLSIARAQRQDLASALRWLLKDLEAGKKQHKVYRQLKLYNDPNFNPAIYESKRST